MDIKKYKKEQEKKTPIEKLGKAIHAKREEEKITKGSKEARLREKRREMAKKIKPKYEKDEGEMGGDL